MPIENLEWRVTVYDAKHRITKRKIYQTESKFVEGYESLVYIAENLKKHRGTFYTIETEIRNVSDWMRND